MDTCRQLPSIIVSKERSFFYNRISTTTTFIHHSMLPISVHVRTSVAQSLRAASGKNVLCRLKASLS